VRRPGHDFSDVICQLDFFEEGGSFTAILDPPKQRRFGQNDRAQLGQELVTGGDAARLLGYLRIGELEPFPIALLENQPATHGLGQAPQMFGMDGHTMLVDLLGRPDDTQVSLLTVFPCGCSHLARE